MHSPNSRGHMEGDAKEKTKEKPAATIWPRDKLCTGCSIPLALIAVHATNGWFCLPCLMRGRAVDERANNAREHEIPLRLAPHFFLTRWNTRGIKLSDLSPKARARTRECKRDEYRLAEPLDGSPLAAWLLRPVSEPAPSAKETLIPAAFWTELSRSRLAFQDELHCSRCHVMLLVYAFRRADLSSSKSNMAASRPLPLQIQTDFCLRCFLQVMATEQSRPLRLETDMTPWEIGSQMAEEYFSKWRWSIVCPTLPSSKAAARPFPAAATAANPRPNNALDFQDPRMAVRALSIANRLRARLQTEGFGSAIMSSPLLARSVLDIALASVGFASSRERLNDGYTALSRADEGMGLISSCERQMWRDERRPVRALVEGRSIFAPALTAVEQGTEPPNKNESRAAARAAAVLIKKYPEGHVMPLWGPSSSRTPSAKPDVLLMGHWSAEIGDLAPPGHKLPVVPTIAMKASWMQDTICLLEEGWQHLQKAVANESVALGQHLLGDLRILIIPLTRSEIHLRSQWDQTARDRRVRSKNPPFAKTETKSSPPSKGDEKVDEDSEEAIGRYLSSVAESLQISMPKNRNVLEWRKKEEERTSLMIARPIGHSLIDLLQPAPYGMYLFEAEVLSVAIDGTWEVNSPASDRTLPPPIHFVSRVLIQLIRCRLSVLGPEFTGRVLQTLCGGRSHIPDLVSALRLAAGFASVENVLKDEKKDDVKKATELPLLDKNIPRAPPVSISIQPDPPRPLPTDPPKPLPADPPKQLQADPPKPLPADPPKPLPADPPKPLPADSPKPFLADHSRILLATDDLAPLVESASEGEPTSRDLTTASSANKAGIPVLSPSRTHAESELQISTESKDCWPTDIYGEIAVAPDLSVRIDSSDLPENDFIGSLRAIQKECAAGLLPYCGKSVVLDPARRKIVPWPSTSGKKYDAGWRTVQVGEDGYLRVYNVRTKSTTSPFPYSRRARKENALVAANAKLHRQRMEASGRARQRAMEPTVANRLIFVSLVLSVIISILLACLALFFE
jgi:hypothetical protein